MKPCKECPFSPTNPDKSKTSEGLVVFIGAVCNDEGQLCHMANDDRECEGARRFFAGEEGVFPSILEMVKARDPETLATQFFTQLERLMAADDGADLLPSTGMSSGQHSTIKRASSESADTNLGG